MEGHLDYNRANQIEIHLPVKVPKARIQFDSKEEIAQKGNSRRHFRLFHLQKLREFSKNRKCFSDKFGKDLWGTDVILEGVLVVEVEGRQ